jgi:hypothetical protein
MTERNFRQGTRYIFGKSEFTASDDVFFNTSEAKRPFRDQLTNVQVTRLIPFLEFGFRNNNHFSVSIAAIERTVSERARAAHSLG